GGAVRGGPGPRMVRQGAPPVGPPGSPQRVVRRRHDRDLPEDPGADRGGPRFGVRRPDLAPGVGEGVGGRALPAGGPAVTPADALSRYPFLRPGERARAAIAALALGRLRPSPSLDERTFGAWLRDRRQSPAAIDALWNLIALPTLNLPAQEASLALAVKVFRT